MRLPDASYSYKNDDSGFTLSGSEINKRKANHEGLIDSFHRRRCDASEPFYEPPLVRGSDLIQEHNRIDAQAAVTRVYQDARGALSQHIRRDGRHDCYRAVLVANVVLQNKSWARVLDFGA